MKSDSSKDSSGITTHVTTSGAASPKSDSIKNKAISLNVVKSNGHLEIFEGEERTNEEKEPFGLLRSDTGPKIVIAPKDLVKKIDKLPSLNEAPLPKEEERNFVEEIVKQELDIEQVADFILNSKNKDNVLVLKRVLAFQADKVLGNPEPNIEFRDGSWYETRLVRRANGKIGREYTNLKNPTRKGRRNKALSRKLLDVLNRTIQ